MLSSTPSSYCVWSRSFCSPKVSVFPVYNVCFISYTRAVVAADILLAPYRSFSPQDFTRLRGEAWEKARKYVCTNRGSSSSTTLLLSVGGSTCQCLSSVLCLPFVYLAIGATCHCVRTTHIHAINLSLWPAACHTCKCITHK